MNVRHVQASACARPARPRRRALVALVALVLALCSCTGAGSTTDASGQLDPNGTLRYVFVQNPSTFDPHRSGNPWDMIFFRLVYDQLILEDQQGKLQPQLATAWEFVEGGKALALTLRDDVTFIDGEKFDAEVVKANLQRAKTLEGSTLAGDLSVIDSIEVVNPTRVRLKFNGPAGHVPGLLSDRHGSMISPAALDNADLDQKPVGSGMATLVEYIPGQVSRYERNPEYWEPAAAAAAKYEIYAQQSSPTRMNMLASGQAELTYLLPADAESAKSRGLNVAPSLSESIMSFFMNTGRPPFNDVRVRQATEAAIDKQALIDGVFFGMGNPVSQFIPPDHWAYNPEVTPDEPEFGYDPDKAKRLLAEAGYPNGFEFEMVVPGLDDHRAIAEALVPMLAEVGIRAKTRVIESPTTPDTFYVRQEGDAYPGMGAPFADPSMQYLTNLPGSFSNPWNTVSKEFNKAFEKSLIGSTNQERLPALHEMIAEDKVLEKRFPMIHATPPSAWTDKVVFPDGYEPAYAPTFRYVGVSR